MIYLATASGPKPCQAIADGHLGQMVTPNTGNRIVPGAVWALDNGCFSDQWSAKKWTATLDRHRNTPGCLFAVAPDVVGDAKATHDMWCRWWPATMRRGYRTAYVAQDGIERLPVGPTVLFIGGTTEWKLSRHARRITHLARSLGWWVHMGRVNSLRRLRYAAEIGCQSADGTYLAYGPEQNLPRLLAWVTDVRAHRQLQLFGGEAA